MEWQSANFCCLRFSVSSARTAIIICGALRGESGGTEGHTAPETHGPRSGSEHSLAEHRLAEHSADTQPTGTGALHWPRANVIGLMCMAVGRC